MFFHSVSPPLALLQRPSSRRRRGEKWRTRSWLLGFYIGPKSDDMEQKEGEKTGTEPSAMWFPARMSPRGHGHIKTNLHGMSVTLFIWITAIPVRDCWDSLTQQSGTPKNFQPKSISYNSGSHELTWCVLNKQESLDKLYEIRRERERVERLCNQCYPTQYLYSHT